MNLKYKEREDTNMIRVLFEPKNMSIKDIYKKQRREGLFNIGYHFIILPTGEIAEGVPFYAYADYRLSHVRDSVYCLLVGVDNKDHITDGQRKVLQQVHVLHKLPVLFGDDDNV